MTEEINAKEFYEKAAINKPEPPAWGTIEDDLRYPEQKEFASDSRMAQLPIEELPRHIESKLEGALIEGAAAHKKAFDFHLGTCMGLELLDAGTIKNLKELRGELTGIWDDHRAVQDKVNQVLRRLRTQKR
jgi:hypothetical protein